MVADLMRTGPSATGVLEIPMTDEQRERRIVDFIYRKQLGQMLLPRHRVVHERVPLGPVGQVTTFWSRNEAEKAQIHTLPNRYTLLATLVEAILASKMTPTTCVQQVQLLPVPALEL